MSSPTQQSLHVLQQQVSEYYIHHQRTMPWRYCYDPYRIMVSEVMLQQTQVTRVIDKYRQFCRQFPTFRSLARATVSQLMAQWQGLGYNRRVLYLQRAAQAICDSGTVPICRADWERLPGIGAATAGAIIVYSFNRYELFIETNIRRVFLHHCFPADTHVPDTQLYTPLAHTLRGRSPRQWYYALTDYGAMLGKRVANPNVRSKHYQQQSSFEGSHRQLRGYILRTVTENGSLFPQQVTGYKHYQPAEIERAFSALVTEGFLVQHTDGSFVARS